MRALLLCLIRLFYRFRAYNAEVLQTPGPVLLIPNHVSWLDWLFVGALLERDWRFVVSSVAANYSWVHRKIMINRRTFAVDPASPYAAKHLAELLGQGGRLVLFAEGQISQTGSLMKLYDGTGFLLHKTRARVITCYLRGAEPPALVAAARLAALVAARDRALQPRFHRAQAREVSPWPGARPAHQLAARPDDPATVRDGDGIRPDRTCWTPFSPRPGRRRAG